MSEQADALVDHLVECAKVDAAIVVDGSADGIIAELVAAGWTLQDRTDLVAGKRIRYVTPP